MAWDRRLTEYQTLEKGHTTARYSFLRCVKVIPRIVKRRDEVTTIIQLDNSGKKEILRWWGPILRGHTVLLDDHGRRDAQTTLGLELHPMHHLGGDNAMFFYCAISIWFKIPRRNMTISQPTWQCSMNALRRSNTTWKNQNCVPLLQAS